MTTTIPERRFALTKVEPGAYMLPSNDQQYVWMIRKYEEDGSAQRLQDDGSWKPVVGIFWAIGRVTHDEMRRFYDAAQNDPYATADWWALDWDWYEQMLPTRKAAVDAAMRYGR